MQYKNSILAILVACTLSITYANQRKHTYIAIKGGYTSISKQKSTNELTKNELVTQLTPNILAALQSFTTEFDQIIANGSETQKKAVATLALDELFEQERLNGNSTQANLEATYAKTFNASIAIGRKYNSARIEYEANFVKTKIDQVSTKITIEGFDVGIIEVGSATMKNTAGDGYIFSNMINGYLDFATGHTLTPFVGVGLGFSLIKNKFAASGVKEVQSSSTVFAYQAMAGLQLAVSKSFRILAEYKFTGSTKTKELSIPAPFSVTIENVTVAGKVKTDLKDKLFTHNFNLGFIMIIA